MMPMELDRRTLFLSSAATIGANAASPAAAQPVPVTQTLARYVVHGQFEDLPADVRSQAKRSLLNYVGVAVGDRATKPLVMRWRL